MIVGIYNHNKDLIVHPDINLTCYNVGWGKPTEERDDALLSQIADEFNKRVADESLNYDSEVWSNHVNDQKEFINALKDKNLDKLYEMMRNIFKTHVTDGVGSGKYSFESLSTSIDSQFKYGSMIYDKLLSIMEYNRSINNFSPEQYFYVQHHFKPFYTVSPDVYLDTLMQRYDITAPKYSGGLFGLNTKYGVYSERDFLSIGIALMINSIYGDKKDISICEIGPGMGHLAYYLYKLGFKNITLIDLPTMSAAQKFFLHSNLNGDKIKFIAPKDFDGKFDLVINVDSFPEMSPEASMEYMKYINENTSRLISINQEACPFHVTDHCTMKYVGRHPFWFRKGYLYEEFVKNVA